VLTELFRELHILLQQSSIDEQLLSLVFDHEIDDESPIDVEEFKQQLSMFLLEKNTILKQLAHELAPHSKFSEDNTVIDLQSSSLSAYVIQLEALITRYSQINKSLSEDLNQCKNTQSELINTYKKRLAALYKDINIHYKLHASLNELTMALPDVDSSGALLVNIEDVVILLLKSIEYEKENSKYFLETIHQEIDDINGITQVTKKLSESSAHQRQLWDKSANKHLQNLSDMSQRIELSENDDKVFTKEIAQLNSAMSDKAHFDQQMMAAQQNQITQLTSKLEHIEKEAKSYHSQLAQQKLINMQDSLTKLPNRKALETEFESRFQYAKSSNQSLWVVVADIDHFKTINDKYGHSAGDKTLQVIASSLGKSLRESEFIARFGGEEFVFLIPNLSSASINNVLNRVRERIKSIPFKFKNTKVQITISLGATRVKSNDLDRKASFDRADKALYQAKKLGRDQVRIF